MTYLGYHSYFVVKFPAEWEMLVTCVAVYAVLQAACYYVDTFLEKEAIFIAVMNKVSSIFLLTCS